MQRPTVKTVFVPRVDPSKLTDASVDCKFAQTILNGARCYRCDEAREYPFLFKNTAFTVSTCSGDPSITSLRTLN